MKCLKEQRVAYLHLHPHSLNNLIDLSHMENIIIHTILIQIIEFFPYNLYYLEGIFGFGQSKYKHPKTVAPVTWCIYLFQLEKVDT